MKRASRILVATVLILMSMVIFQLSGSLHNLESRLNLVSTRLTETIIATDGTDKRLDLSVLDSCGIITNGGTSWASCSVIEPNLVLIAGHSAKIPDRWIDIRGVRYKILSRWWSEKYDVGFAVIDANLPYLTLGDDPIVLDEIYLVGAPYQIGFRDKISKGIVCKVGLEDRSTVVNWIGCFLCDAMTGTGNSGGPALNKAGKIVGICVGMWSGADSTAVCVPASQIKIVLGEYHAGFAGNPNTGPGERT